MTVKWVVSFIWFVLALALSCRLAAAYTSVECLSNPASLTSDTEESVLCASVAPVPKFNSGAVETETLTYRDGSTKLNLLPVTKPAQADPDSSSGTWTDILTEVPEPASLGLLGGGLALVGMLRLARRTQKS